MIKRITEIIAELDLQDLRGSRKSKGLGAEGEPNIDKGAEKMGRLLDRQIPIVPSPRAGQGRRFISFVQTFSFLNRIDREVGNLDLYNKVEEVDAFLKGAQCAIMTGIRKQFVQAILKKYGPESRLNVLDVGTGPAWISCLLAKARPAWTVVALDASTLMLDIARKNAEKVGLHIDFVLSKAEKTSIQANRFDLLVSHFAFHECPNGEAALREMERLLKPGGWIVIQDLIRPYRWQMPFFSAWGSVIKIFGRRFGRQYLKSLRAAYTADEMRALLGRSGLRFAVDTFMRWGGGLVRVWATKPIRGPVNGRSKTQAKDAKNGRPQG